MRRAFAIAMCLLLLATTSVFAQRGGGGGRSYSGGSSSGSSSGRSYSGGSSSSSGSSSGRSYSGGSSSSGSKSSPSVVSQSGTKSYGGGSSSSSSSSSTKVNNSSGTRSYSGGSSNTLTPAPTSVLPKTGTKPNTWDVKGGQVQREVESQQVLRRAETTKPNYTTPTGTTKPIDQTSQSTKVIREISPTQYSERPMRHYTIYQNYYSRPVPTVFYNDPYDHFFYWWLLDRTTSQQAYWVYNHYNDVDHARIADMYAHDMDLEARVRQLETEKGVNGRDPAWAPQGVDHDLMYGDDYVNAVYNPHTYYTPTPVNWGRVGYVSLVILFVLLTTCIVGAAFTIEESRPLTIPLSVLCFGCWFVFFFGWCLGMVALVACYAVFHAIFIRDWQTSP
jgi:hypothetical protein